MPNPVIGIAAASAGSGLVAANAQKKAAQSASAAQTASAEAGIAEQRRQFDKVQQLLRPFVNQGTRAFRQAAGLAGARGPEAEARQIQRVIDSPTYQAALEQGQESILSQASATGGLRGGDTQAALAQFAPQLLSQEIQNRFSRLGGLGQVGQSAAAGVGSAAQVTGQNVANLQGQIGAAQAGGALAQGQATQTALGGITQGLGTVFGSTGTTIPEGQTVFSRWGF